MQAQKPSVGRIIHVTDKIMNPDTCLAAIVTRVNEEGKVTAAVFNANGVGSFSAARMQYREPDGEHELATTWHWPERVS